MSEANSSTLISEVHSRRRFSLDTVILLVMIVTVHVLVSALVVTYLSIFHGHRIINLSHWQNRGNEWEEVTATFAHRALSEAKRAGKHSLAVIGSSVSYGFPYHQRAAFSQSLAEALPQYHVANLSIVGAGMDAITDYYKCSLGPQARPHVLVAEIPLVNSISSISPSSDLRKRTCAYSSRAAWGYWGLALPRPHGIGWVALLWEELMHDDPRQGIKVGRLPADFFADNDRFSRIEQQYKQVLMRYLDDLSAMGDKVYVFVSPIYLPAVTQAGGDERAVARQLSLTLALCRDHGWVTCLDTTQFYMQGDLYFNLTHFNPRGNKVFGDWLAKQIERRS